MKMLSTARARLVLGGGAERGATSVEYALMASLIAVVIIAALVLLGTNVLRPLRRGRLLRLDWIQFNGWPPPICGPIRVENGKSPRGFREVSAARLVHSKESSKGSRRGGEPEPQHQGLR